jgi:hypothetical protein
VNGKERILAALELKQPDVVPIWEMAYNESSIIGIAKHFVEAENLPEPKLIMDMSDTERSQVLGALIAFVRELDLDGVTAVSLAPRERLDKQHIRDAIGVVYHLSEFGEPYPVDGPIRERSDLFPHARRAPLHLSREVDRLSHARHLQALLDPPWLDGEVPYGLHPGPRPGP